jgi:hypothetical protein
LCPQKTATRGESQAFLPNELGKYATFEFNCDVSFRKRPEFVWPYQAGEKEAMGARFQRWLPVSGIACIAVVWCFALVGGLVCLADYASKPGTPGASLDAWPASSRISRETGRYTLVVVVHAECPCSAATLSEAMVVADRCGPAVCLRVLIVGRTDDGEKSLFPEMPGQESVTNDPEGREARLFGAETSGQVVLFDPSGRQRFQGGITAARGHSGDNFGRQRVIGIIQGTKDSEGDFPVFGCRLRTLQSQSVP